MKRIFYLMFFLPGMFCSSLKAQNISGYSYTAGSPATYLKGVLAQGQNLGWSTQVQASQLVNYLAVRTAAQQAGVVALIQAAHTASAKFFALKSLLGGDVESTVQTFITELNGLTEPEQQSLCTVFHHQGLVQKWQYSCSIAVVLTYLAELSPRYAFDVKKVAGYNQIITDAANDMAQQEKVLLEQYGGKASARGDGSGKAIGINGPLNDFVGRVLGVQFYAKEITGPVTDALTNIRTLLDAGMNVPALIDFLPSHASHFILFFRSKLEVGQWWYLIYEPWEGKCDWVSTSTLQANSLSPLLTQYSTQLRYYYPTTGK